jgi:hypothetical protein
MPLDSNDIADMDERPAGLDPVENDHLGHSRKKLL